MKAEARRSALSGAPRRALDLKEPPLPEATLEMPEPTGSPMIHVEHLSKHFSDFRRGSIVALEGVSFDVHPGEIFGLLGPNGAGKTTCLRVLSTVLTPTSGIATVAGYDVLTQAADVRARIGFMSGNTGIYDRMTAWELVEYFARLYGMEEPLLSQRLNEIFTTLQMHEFRDVLGSKMSTGMKQKVSIARTIVHNPPVLIFDEPTTGLDVLVARAVLKQIESLRKQGKCIIFSTHIMREVEKLCDRVAIIHKGRILAAGTPTELLDRSGQSDFEELFFELISQAEERMAATA
jgi:sodium transport system ATP-binding protein